MEQLLQEAVEPLNPHGRRYARGWNPHGAGTGHRGVPARGQHGTWGCPCMEGRPAQDTGVSLHGGGPAWDTGVSLHGGRQHGTRGCPCTGGCSAWDMGVSLHGAGTGCVRGLHSGPAVGGTSAAGSELEAPCTKGQWAPRQPGHSHNDTHVT